MNLDRYLRKHWQAGEYNCWDLVREFYLNELRIDLPYVPIDANDIALVSHTIQNSELRSLFTQIDAPVNSCVVELQRKHQQPSKPLARHVGIFINSDRILHNSGVVGCFPACRVLVDWDILGYFLHVSDSRIS